MSCHIAVLRDEIGEEVSPERLTALIDSYYGTITCVGIQGGDNDPEAVLQLCAYIHEHYDGRIHTGWYSGRTWLPTPEQLKASLNYIKTGPYIAKFGPLSSPDTNQRFYRINTEDGSLKDLTHRFAKKKV